MKQVSTWLNEYEYKEYIQLADKMKINSYQLTKKLVTDFVKEQNFWQKQSSIISYLVWLSCYMLVATSIVLLIL